MAPKKSTNIKTKAKRVSESTFEPVVVFDQTTFHTLQYSQKFESLVKCRSIWGEGQVNLDELDCSLYRNLESRKWLSLCFDLIPSPAALIREFYSNL